MIAPPYILKIRRNRPEARILRWLIAFGILASLAVVWR